MFIYGSRDTLKSFALFITVKTIAKLHSEHSDEFEKKKKKMKNSRRGSRSPDNTEFGHFTFLTCWRTAMKCAKTRAIILWLLAKNCNARAQLFFCSFKVSITPKYFFGLNKSLHLSKTHCAFLK